jgi:hypothetical protein
MGSGGRIEIVNYERIHLVEPGEWSGVVLDESSILKSVDGATRGALLDAFSATPYRLCCTATPAPNDPTEIGNHAHFLGVMTRAEMLASFFVNRGEGNRSWDLKGHAREAFYKWLASWSCFINKPSDLGYSDDGFTLPELHIHGEIIATDSAPPGRLFRDRMKGVTERAEVRKATVSTRVTQAAALAWAADGQVIVWCGLNEEQETMADALGDDCVSVTGSQSSEEKREGVRKFLSGERRVLVTKGAIVGFGMNFQCAATQVFVGLSDSYEQYYQYIRRSWRYGQTRPVNAYIVLTDIEEEILVNVKRKEREAEQLQGQMVGRIVEYEKDEIHDRATVAPYEEVHRSGSGWDLWRGDSSERLAIMAPASVDLAVFSPPFADLYTYSASERDLGNSRSVEEFLEHFSFIVAGLMRVMKPGRIVACHCQQLPLQKAKHGVIGQRDFRGDLIRVFQEGGFVYHGEITIDKNPQALKDGTPVLTPHGWRDIETLSTGETVIGSDGRPTTVLGVWPQGARMMYRVTFSDGISVECDARHLWTVRTEGRKYSSAPDAEWITMRTEDLAGRLYSPTNRPRYEIPILSDPVEYFPNQSPLPLSPYLLGVIIGDGGIGERATVGLTTEREIIDLLELPDEGCTVRRLDKSEKGNVGVATFHIGHKEWHVNPVLDALRAMGLQGCRAWEKFIPECYATANPESRWELLRGLMDTDGTCKKNACCYYSTVSHRLADDVSSLVRSLGGLVTVAVEHPTYRYKGETRAGRPRYIITVRVPACPFKLPRKAIRWHRTRDLRRSIVAIEATTNAQCTCITVSNRDGLFVTDGYAITHNSQAIRTRTKGLSFSQLEKDAAWMRPAFADYVVLLRAPGDNEIPVKPDCSREEWIEWASPVWYHIRESDTLQVAEARSEEDEKHICALQLPTIRRCVRLWSNRGEVVLSPFAGIGSEGYEAIKCGRRFVGIELKDAYARVAAKNLLAAEHEVARGTLFSDQVEPPVEVYEFHRTAEQGTGVRVLEMREVGDE